MRKILSLVLCIVLMLCMAIPASAEETAGTTVISLTVDPTMESYTLTIPADVTIDPTTKSGTVSVTLSDVTFAWSTELHVYASSANDWHLVNQEDATKTIQYRMKTNLNGTNSSSGKTLEVANCKMREREAGMVQEYNENQNNTMNNALTILETYPGAGTYTDTLTFTVTSK